MKISMFPIVARTMRVRDDLLADIALVEDGKMGVTVHGRYQDEVMIAVCKPAVLAELKGRLASLDQDLESYGVRLDDGAD